MEKKTLHPSVLYRLNHQYDQSLYLIGDLSESFIHKNHSQNKWSIFQNLTHLGRYQQVFRNRIDKILNEDTPKFERYRAQDDSAYANWNILSIDEVLQRSKKERAEIYNKISSLTPKQALRKGIHPKFGVLTIEEWIEFFLLHESHHLYTIFRLSKEFSK